MNADEILSHRPEPDDPTKCMSCGHLFSEERYWGHLVTLINDQVGDSYDEEAFSEGVTQGREEQLEDAVATVEHLYGDLWDTEERAPTMDELVDALRGT